VSKASKASATIDHEPAAAAIQAGQDWSSLAAQDLRQRGVSRYVQLAQLFRRRIETGIWTQGNRIPTVAELADECGVARETVRQSLDIIEREGLIKRFRAKGTFVTGVPRERTWCELHTDFFGLLQSRVDARIELLSETRNVQIQDQIDFGYRASAYRHLKRRHWRKGEPYMFADVYLAEHIMSKVPRAALSTVPALKIVADVAGLELGAAEQIMRIGAADLEVSEALQTPLNAPVAFIDRYWLDKSGELILFAPSVYRADVVRLHIKLR